MGKILYSVYYKVFQMSVVIKTMGRVQTNAFFVDETVLTVVEALPVWA